MLPAPAPMLNEAFGTSIFRFGVSRRNRNRIGIGIGIGIGVGVGQEREEFRVAQSFDSISRGPWE